MIWTHCVGDEAGLVEHDFVAGRHHGANDGVERLAHADRDHRLHAPVIREAGVGLRHVAADGLAEIGEAEVGGVVRGAALQGGDGRLADVPGRHEIGFADAEADDVVARGDDVEEGPYAGARKVADERRDPLKG